MLNQLRQRWQSAFGSTPPDIIVCSPGRVNIIGEHTDYNQGWVLPGAMSRVMYLLISPSATAEHHWLASDLNEVYHSGAPVSSSTPKPSWVKYIEGAIQLYDPEIGGLYIVFGGDLPVGAGISSSSALVCGILFGLQQLTGGKESKVELALTGSRVERELIGLQGGIMDQFAIMLSQPEHLLLLDCQSKLYQHVRADLPGCRWILINTKVKHELIDSDYNLRAEECARAVEIIRETHRHINSLRDVSAPMLEEIQLPEVLYRRAQFVLEENDRVHQMVRALQEKKATQAGNLLHASHRGLRHQYEVSCDELDFLVDFVNSYTGVFGARMMGGGFGGCVLCLLQDHVLESLCEVVVEAYAGHFGYEPEIILFELGGGVRQMDRIP